MVTYGLCSVVPAAGSTAAAGTGTAGVTVFIVAAPTSRR